MAILGLTESEPGACIPQPHLQCCRMHHVTVRLFRFGRWCNLDSLVRQEWMRTRRSGFHSGRACFEA